ncbi:hypothetical protein CkaCkLH20_08467 [Colletotrichum karsti]|uniref:SnoaL-like domain-containing protein n=1 Tax=Colletotrichum karsti TaxID=1095194 RepID=A0A9P6LIT4_9PEZI|nr:uncharacterized protein CkaCkLH20_08467 [Colletotrichum karsti]KAF9874095.1 hypothetical protein CkaCkLH20_08467 [Colletotrichum karsti]
MTSDHFSTTIRERIEATARAFLSAYEEGGAQGDASIINRDVTADCSRYLLPASELFAKDIKVLKFTNNVMANLIIDTEARRAAFTSIAEVHSVGGETYPAELAWYLYFNEDGSKVKKVVEFCDKDVILRMANTSA